MIAYRQASPRPDSPGPPPTAVVWWVYDRKNPTHRVSAVAQTAYQAWAAALLLRELAEAIEQEDTRPAKRPRRMTEEPAVVTDPEMLARVRRGLRRAGLKT